MYKFIHVMLQNIIEVEKSMLSQEISIPVYFLAWEKALQTIISNVDVITATNDVNDNKRETAVDGDYGVISS